MMFQQINITLLATTMFPWQYNNQMKSSANGVNCFLTTVTATLKLFLDYRNGNV